MSCDSFSVRFSGMMYDDKKMWYELLTRVFWWLCNLLLFACQEGMSDGNLGLE
jgi:hypothetical protein